MVRGAANHARKQYVRGDVDTNSLEGFWSLLKRAIRGTDVSAKLMSKNLGEFEYRHNMQKDVLPAGAELLAR